MQIRAKTPKTATTTFSAGYELNVSRGVRLKYVALQMPQMKAFLHKFSKKFSYAKMHHKFRQWVKVYRYLQEQYMTRIAVLTNAITPIQAIVRGFNGRNKFRQHKDSYQRAKAEEIRKRWSVYQIQCFARWWLVRQKVARRLRLRLANRHGKAAVLIQKRFRGFLSRALTVELEKQKLLRHLRQWSHGISNHLVNMKELQNGFSQHVLFQAIAITTLPSRPLRDLPKLQYVRTVRRSLVLLYWRLQGHFSSRKNEYKRRQKERREMYLQDLSSQLVEILALGNAKKLRAEQEAYEQLLLREAREEAHRLEVQQQCLILDSSSRAAVTARRKMEADKQHAYKAKLIKLAEHEKVLDDMLKESELMKLEEVLMRKVLIEETAANERRRLIAQQTKRVKDAKLSGIVLYGEEARYSKAIFSEHLRQLVPTFEKPIKDVKKSKYDLPFKPAQVALTPGELGMIKYRQQKALEFQRAALAFKSYLQTLPLTEDYVERVYQTLLDSQTEVEFPETKDVPKENRAAVNPVTSAQKCPLPKPELPSVAIGTDSPPDAVLDLKFLSKQLENENFDDIFHPVNTISNLHCTTQEVCVKIKGMVTRPQMVQLFGPELGYTLGIAQQQYPMQLQSTLTVDDDAVTKMRLLLQLRHHRKVRVRGYKALILAHATFKRALFLLHQKRTEIHTTKYLTRQARKTALSEASIQEVNVQERRQALIDLCSSFYVSFHEEVELFLCLFYPVEMLPEEVKHYEEEQNEMIISRRVLFASGGAHNNSGRGGGATSSAQAPLSTPSLNINVAASASEVVPQGSPQRRSSVTFGEPNLRRNSVIGAHPAIPSNNNNQASIANSAVPAAPFDSPGTTSSKMGRRSSRMDTVYIAPKRANKDIPASSSAKLTRSRRETMVYTAPTTKKAHQVDPFHALNQIPVNKTLQRKLAASKSKALLPEVDRKLTYLDYWSGIEQEMQYYAVSPVAIVALPAAPIPTFNNDGKPHILKYGESGVASKRIDASHVHKHFAQQNTAIVNAKLKLKEALQKPQNFLKKEVKLHDIPGFNLFTQSDVQEYDFFLWAEKVLLWSKELSGWFRTQESAWRQHNRMQSLTYLLRLQYLAEEDKTSKDSADGGSSSSVRNKAANRLVRMKMLAASQQLKQQSAKENMTDHTRDIAPARDASEQRAEQNSLFLLRHLDQADTLDVFELLLCKANYGLKIANSQTKLDMATLAAASTSNTNNNNNNNTAARSNMANASRILSADELDVTVAKHPASVTARFIIIQQALQQLDTSADPAVRGSLLQLTCQNGLLFGTRHTTSSGEALHHEADQFPPTDLTSQEDTFLREGIFRAVPPSLLLLRALSKEVAEMRGILSKLIGDDAVQVELTPPTAPVAISTSSKSNSSGSKKSQRMGAEIGGFSGGAATVLTPVTTEDVLIELQYAKIKPIQYVHCNKDFERWCYEYPSWMHPIVHFGVPAPEETFFRRLDYEMRHGKGGIYTRINALDNRADEAGRVLLRFLRAAVVLRQYVAEKVLTQHRLRTDHELMVWEDHLATAVRVDVEEESLAALRLRRQNRPFVVKLFDCCAPEVAYGSRSRVLHGLYYDAENDKDNDNDGEMYDPVMKMKPFDATSSKAGVMHGSSRFFKPKYAKISVWTSEEEFQSALRSALSVPLPVQTLSKRQVNTEVKRVRNDILLLNRTTGFTIQALLERYPGMGTAEEVLRVAQAARQAGAHYTRENYFRKCSWVTGQAVHLNAKGEHTDMGDGFFAPGVLAEMAQIYSRMDSVVDSTCNQITPVTDIELLAFPSATAVEEKIQEKIDESRRASQTRLYYESTAARTQKPKVNVAVQKAVPPATAVLDRMRVQPEHIDALHRAVAPVHEVWLGGGLRHLLIAMRVVEEGKLNPRGIAHLTSLILPAPEPLLHSAKNMHDQLTGAEGVQQMRKRLKAAALELKKEEERKLAAARRAAMRTPGQRGLTTVKQASTVIANFMRKSSTVAMKKKSKGPAAGTSPDKRRGSQTNATTAAGKTSPGKTNKASSPGKPTHMSTAAPAKAVDAMATIAKFLRSRKFNLSVSRANTKFNYNGTKFRTIDEASIRRINNFNARTAGAKIARFFRAKSKATKPIVNPLSAEEIAEIERRKYQQEIDKILAARAAAEKAENERSILCLPMTELFSRARAGFSDRVLCHDRLWRFASHVTIKRRNLCAASLRVLKQELPVKALPSLRDLQCALVAAVFRERYKFSPVSNTLKSGKEKEKVKELSDSVSTKVSSVRAKAKDKSKAHYVEVIQGLFKIYQAKRLMAKKRASKEQSRFV